MTVRRTPGPINPLQFTLPRGYIDGFITSNDTDSDHDISFAAGSARDSTNTINIETTSAIVKQIDANWAAGSAAGGFPSGLTLSNTTWYHLFAIATPGGLVDSGFDTSTSASNLLSDATGYTYYRRVGSVLTDGSANIYAYTQTGDTFIWGVSKEDYDTDPGATSTDIALDFVPTGINARAHLRVLTTSSTAGPHLCILRSKLEDTISAGASDAAPGTNVGTHQNSTQTGGLDLTLITNTSAEINTYADSGISALRIWVYGWTDLRGRNA